MVAAGGYRAVEPDEWEQDPFSVSSPALPTSGIQNTTLPPPPPVEQREQPMPEPSLVRHRASSTPSARAGRAMWKRC